jgi:hypothetical protein
MGGRREPRFNPGKADPARVRFVKFDRTRRADLLRAARDFQVKPQVATDPFRPERARRIAGAIALATVLGAVTWTFSNLPYHTPQSPEPELVVSFSHAGAILEPRKLTPEELARRLPHMRAQASTSRQRAPVRLRISVDEQVVLEESFQPKGLSKDGPSVAVARLPVSAGRHSVRVEISDAVDPGTWTHQWNQTFHFETNRTRVVLFDAKSGFSLH